MEDRRIGVDWELDSGIRCVRSLSRGYNNYHVHSADSFCGYVCVCIIREPRGSLGQAGRQIKIGIGPRRHFAGRLHYNDDTRDCLSPGPLCIFQTGPMRLRFNRPWLCCCCCCCSASRLEPLAPDPDCPFLLRRASCPFLPFYFGSFISRLMPLANDNSMLE